MTPSDFKRVLNHVSVSDETFPHNIREVSLIDIYESTSFVSSLFIFLFMSALVLKKNRELKRNFHLSFLQTQIFLDLPV